MEIFAIVVQITHVKLWLQLTMMGWQLCKLYMSDTTLQMTTQLQQNSSMSEAENNLVIYNVDQQNCKTWMVLETLEINLINLLQIPLPPPCGEHGINSRLNGYLVIISMNQHNFMSHDLS